MVTIIVSPTARERPRITAAPMPEKAVGTTTRKTVARRLAPSASEASRRLRGTAWSASSLSEATIGRIITPITSPGLRALKPASPGTTRWSTGVTSSSAK